MPQVHCNQCNKQFYAKSNWIKIGWGKYCSIKCRSLSQRNGKYVKCFTCKKDVYKSQKSLVRSKSGNWFCSKSCQTLWRNSFFIGEKHGNWKGGEESYRERLLRTKIVQICRFCKLRDIRILAVHHLDRNRQNNKLENLVWLCHNCHYLIHHDKQEDKKFTETLV